jgi:general stress protein YciG
MSIHDRGFASLSPERLAEISRQGGLASHKSGHGYEWNARTARKAGQLGGKASGITRKRKADDNHASLRSRDSGTTDEK